MEMFSLSFSFDIVHLYMLVFPKISGMCKTPLPFFDFIMLSHLVLTVNVFFGSIVPEYYLFLAALVGLCVCVLCQ